MQDISYVPSLIENKEYRFLYAVTMSSGARRLEDSTVIIGTTGKNIFTDIETTVQGEDSSDYCVDFNSGMVDSVFLENMKQYGYELHFISSSEYTEDKGEFTVWFKEVKQ